MAKYLGDLRGGSLTIAKQRSHQGQRLFGKQRVGWRIHWQHSCGGGRELRPPFECCFDSETNFVILFHMYA